MNALYVHSDSFQRPASLDPKLCLEGDETASMVQRIINRFEGLGIRVNPSSRLLKYKSILANNTSSSLERDIAQNNALLESLQFLAIANSLENMSDSKAWSKRIQSAMAGATTATNDSLSSRARSLQFELFMMAVLVAAGFEVEPAEPDLLVTLGNSQVLAVAVKRPKSETKIMRNLHSAAQQIAVVGLPGIIAIDLSFVERVQKPIWISKPNDQQVTARVILDGYVAENQGQLLRVMDCPCVVGVLLYMSCVVRTVRPHVMMASRRWVLIGQEPHPSAMQVMRAIQELGREPIVTKL